MARATWSERLEHLDRRWIFLVMLVAMSLPLFLPVDLPIRVSPEVRAFHAAVEGLEPGSVVYFAADLDPASTAELLPMLRTSLDHLFERDVRVVGATLWPAGPPILETELNAAAGRAGKIYGTDYVNLGFKEGRESVMVQLGKSFRAVYPLDYYRTPVGELPLMAELRSDGAWRVDNFNDVELIVNISAGFPGTKEWVQQVRSRFSIPIVSGCTAVSAPEYYPYVQSGQLHGLLGGLAGAAEYESLTGRRGWATSGMSGQSLGHVVIVLLIVLGNILFFVNRGRGGAAS
jgi:hypothetical protein